MYIYNIQTLFLKLKCMNKVLAYLLRGHHTNIQLLHIVFFYQFYFHFTGTKYLGCCILYEISMTGYPVSVPHFYLHVSYGWVHTSKIC